jgi:uncharacterized membrane protein YgcG
MTTFFIIVILIMVVALGRRSLRANKHVMNPRKSMIPTARVRYDASLLPSNLGLLDSMPLTEAVERMEASFSPEFLDRLEYRVTSKYNRMSHDEYVCKVFELKRFFLMNLILKRTPMFSEEVDDIWHEMLMFTREYQNFGDSFSGSQIHHAPEREPKQMPGERAWFDWVYAHMFAFTPFSTRIWNGFFRYPIDEDRLNVLHQGNEYKIKELWFDTESASRFPEVQEAIQVLISQAINEANHAAGSTNFEQTSWSQRSGTSDMTYLAGAMLFFSMTDSMNYNSNIDTVLPADESLQRKDSSGCSSSGCGSSGLTDNGSGGDSGGGSSCSSGSDSSCGSGCSS